MYGGFFLCKHSISVLMLDRLIEPTETELLYGL